MTKKRIGFLIYPSIQALDVAGPMDAFAAATIDNGKRQSEPGYEIFTIGLSATSVAAESGLIFKPQFTAESAPRMDTLVIPGGRKDVTAYSVEGDCDPSEIKSNTFR